MKAICMIYSVKAITLCFIQIRLYVKISDVLHTYECLNKLSVLNLHSGQVWCSATSDGRAQHALLTDVHSHEKVR